MKVRTAGRWNDKWRRLRRDKLFAGSATLGMGMMVSQGLALVTMPILTRLYDAQAFGVLAVYSAIVGILGTAASLRYEFAIPLPRRVSSAVDLVQIALLLTLVLSLLMAISIWSIAGRMVAMLHAQATPHILVLVPVGVVALSVYQTLNFWALRERAYVALARTRITQGVGRVLVQVGGALFLPGAYALVAGDIIGQSAGVFRLATLFSSRQRKLLRRWEAARLRTTAARFREFPMFSLPSNLLAMGVHQVMPLLLGFAFGAPAAGLFSLAYKVVQVPINLLNATVSQAYYAEGMQLSTEARGQIRPLFRSTLRRLAMLGAIPAAVLALTAPLLFGMLFGAAWKEAGWMTTLLIPCVYLQALVSPLSQTLLIVERQRLNLGLDICRVAVLATSLTIGKVAGLNVLHTVALYSSTMASLYVVNLIIYDRVLRDELLQSPSAVRVAAT